MNTCTCVNWRTTVSGIGAAICSALTLLTLLPQEMGDFANMIPPQYKSKVLFAAAFAAFLLKVWNSVAAKDAVVSGNGTAFRNIVTPDGAMLPNAPTAGSGIVKAAPIILALLLPALFFSSCAQFAAARSYVTPQTVEAAVNGLVSFIPAGSAHDAIVAALPAASLAVRSLETGKAPAPSTVLKTIATITGSPAVARTLSPAVSSAIQSAAQNGAAIDTAVEIAATAIDKSARKAGKAAK